MTLIGWIEMDVTFPAVVVIARLAQLGEAILQPAVNLIVQGNASFLAIANDRTYK